MNTTYSDCTLSPSKINIDCNRTRVKPFFYIEGKYENEGATTQCLNSQAYWAILGGASGHVFGNKPIWKFSNGWQAALSSTGSQNMSYVGKLFNSRSWSTLVPDYNHTVVTAGYGTIGNDAYVATARTTDGNTALVYMPTNHQVTVDMTKISGSQVKAWWFNPNTGQPTPALLTW